ncbi:MAG TPA: YihY/virulence factor BrkB family protein [Terriglobales bacterium]|nr:YihY/virulence factor BrkB family protein [Terriglobales bacterium]
MTWQQWKHIFRRAGNDLQRNHSFAFANGLSYQFLMGLFPALIALAAVVGYLPIPNLFRSLLDFMSRFVPPDSMGLVRAVVRDVITPNKGKLLSFGLVGSIWAVSGGFAAVMEALNVAYDVPETRPFWKTRLLAIWLSFQIGALMLLALAVMLVGPRFGSWMANTFHLSVVWAYVWPYLRVLFAFVAVVLGVEIMYFAGPNVRQRFRYTVIGSVIAVATWLLLSYGLGLYFRQVVHLNKTYGSLGAAVALMIWMQWTAVSLLIGAEVNSEILKLHTGGEVPLKAERRKELRTEQARRAA